MSDVLFWSLLVGNVLLAIYLSVTPKMHAQPWRLFALGFSSLLLVFWFQDSIDSMVRLIGETKSGRLKSGAALMATAVSAMAGAIFGTAITNRARFLNKKEVEALTERITQAEELCRKPAEKIHAKLTDKTQEIPKGEFFQLVELRKDLQLRYDTKISELMDELRKLSP